MNCAEKLLEPAIFFNLYTKSPYNSGSQSPLRKRDLSQIWNIDIKSYTVYKIRKGFAKFMIPIDLFMKFIYLEC